MQSEARKIYLEEYRKKNKEKIKQYEAERYKKDKDRILTRNKTWNAAHSDRIAEVSKQWDKANPQRRKENGARWQKENPEKVKAIFSKHKTEKTQAGGYFTTEEWFTLCFAVGFKCLCCGEKKPLEADHVIPVSKGGTSWLWNIQPLCRSCNAKKSDKYIDYREEERSV
jgi:5-methylcytosine-specific restriction endonuclease McrA